MTLYIISRHKATIDFLIDTIGQLDDVVILDHLKDVREIPLRAKVAGNLPVNLIIELVKNRGCKFYAVALNIPPELRGQELDFETLKKYVEVWEITDIRAEKII